MQLNRITSGRLQKRTVKKVILDDAYVKQEMKGQETIRQTRRRLQNRINKRNSRRRRRQMESTFRDISFPSNPLPSIESPLIDGSSQRQTPITVVTGSGFELSCVGCGETRGRLGRCHVCHWAWHLDCAKQGLKGGNSRQLLPCLPCKALVEFSATSMQKVPSLDHLQFSFIQGPGQSEPPSQQYNLQSARSPLPDCFAGTRPSTAARSSSEESATIPLTSPSLPSSPSPPSIRLSSRSRNVSMSLRSEAEDLFTARFEKIVQDLSEAYVNVVQEKHTLSKANKTLHCQVVKLQKEKDILLARLSRIRDELKEFR